MRSYLARLLEKRKGLTERSAEMTAVKVSYGLVRDDAEDRWAVGDDDVAAGTQKSESLSAKVERALALKKEALELERDILARCREIMRGNAGSLGPDKAAAADKTLEQADADLSRPAGFSPSLAFLAGAADMIAAGGGTR